MKPNGETEPFSTFRYFFNLSGLAKERRVLFKLLARLLISTFLSG